MSPRKRQGKLPLVIHVEGPILLSLNKTCRFCPCGNLLIAHQDELEAQLVGAKTWISRGYLQGIQSRPSRRSHPVSLRRNSCPAMGAHRCRQAMTA